jgi:hypothetical protein
VRIFAASDADMEGYSGSKCNHFSLHRFDSNNVLISALCPKQDTSTVSALPSDEGNASECPLIAMVGVVMHRFVNNAEGQQGYDALLYNHRWCCSARALVQAFPLARRPSV